MEDGTGSVHSGMSSTTLVDTVAEERERLQALLLETERQELEAEAAAAVAAAERAALQREFLAGNRDLKSLTPKETMKAILEFDQALEQESEAKTKLLEVASQLLKQVQDQYNELYDQLLEERQQRNALLGALQGIHDEMELLQEEQDHAPTDPLQVPAFDFGIGPNSATATPVKSYNNGALSSRTMSPISARSLNFSPLRESGLGLPTPPSMRRLDLDRMGQLLDSAAKNSKTPSALEKVLQRVRQGSRYNSPRTQGSSRSTSKSSTPRLRTKFNANENSNEGKERGPGVFGLFLSVAGMAWNTSKLVTSFVSNVALAPAKVVMFSRSSALLSATVLGAAALITVGHIQSGTNRRRVIS